MISNSSVRMKLDEELPYVTSCSANLVLVILSLCILPRSLPGANCNKIRFNLSYKRLFSNRSLKVSQPFVSCTSFLVH